MKNLKRFLGIIAFVAVIGLVMTACGPEETVEAPSGPISIVPGDGGPYVNFPLNAVYEGTDAVQYYWFKVPPAGETINFDVDKELPTANPPGKRLNQTITGAGATTITPTDAGFYCVVVTGVPTAADPSKAVLQPTFSPYFEVKTPGTQDETSFYGTWKTATEFTPTGESVARHENILINYQYFYLQSSFAGYTAADNKYPTANDDFAAPFEYVKFKINTWTKMSSVPATYSHGYRLGVTTIGFKGYSAYSSFDIYQKIGGATVVFRRTTDNGALEIGRDYEKQASGAALPNITPGKDGGGN